jgi:hypothetical protein
MRPESFDELARRAGEVIAAEFDGVLGGVPFDQLPAAMAVLIRQVFANPDVWNRVWDF